MRPRRFEKSGVTNLFFEKNGQGKFLKKRALMVERNYGSNYKGFLFRGGLNKLILFINYI